MTTKQILVAAVACVALSAFSMTPAQATGFNKLTLRCTTDFVNNFQAQGFSPFLVFVWPQSRTVLFGSEPYQNVTVTEDNIVFPARGGTVLIDRRSSSWYSNDQAGVSANGRCVEVAIDP